VNPLEVVPVATEKDQLRKHIKLERQKWFGCSCCPPNLARLLTSFGDYVYSERGNELYVNLYAGGTVDSLIGFEMTTGYPWDETVKIKITSAKQGAVLALRIPAWCEKFDLNVKHELSEGYAKITNLAAGDEIELVLHMPVTVLEANPRVREDIGKVAVRRGPVVYCLEEADNGSDLHRVYLPEGAEFSCEYDAGFLGGACLLESRGMRLRQDGWDADTLYRKAGPAEFEDVELRWVPYYLWANRGVGEMVCWVRRK